MNAAELDELILTAALPRWQKTAMLVSRVACHERFSAAEADEAFALVAARIAQLVADGRLLAQGNVSDWRSSEVRLKG